MTDNEKQHSNTYLAQNIILQKHKVNIKNVNRRIDPYIPYAETPDKTFNTGGVKRGHRA